MIDHLLTELREHVKFGDFILASGEKSHWYLDCRVVAFGNPLLVGEYVGEKMLSRNTDVLAGVVVGGVPIAVSAACYMGLEGVPVSTFGIRPDPKEHGRFNCVLGPYGPKKVWVVDDVFTTGGSLEKATYRLVEERDIVPAGYLVLVNRNQDLQGIDEFMGKPFVSLYGLQDLQV